MGGVTAENHVARHRNAEPGARGRSVDSHKQWLGHASEADERHVERSGEFAQQRGDVIASLFERADIAARAEQTAGTRQDDTADRLVGLAAESRIDQSPCHRQINGAAGIRPIERDQCDAAVDFEQDGPACH
jgi:hypothetical protein